MATNTPQTQRGIDKAILAELSNMMPQEKIEQSTPNNVLAKMMIEGRADKLLDIVKQILSTYIDRDNYGNTRPTTKNLILTLMLEEKTKNP